MIGSPDPYGKQIDGMGGATSSTSKTVILAKSTQPEHDVDYLFGQVSIDQPFVDWSGNCGNLTAAVGSLQFQMVWWMQRVFLKMEFAQFAFGRRIFKTIIAHVPVTNGQVQETGDFELDGVTFLQQKFKSNF